MSKFITGTRVNSNFVSEDFFFEIEDDVTIINSKMVKEFKELQFFSLAIPEGIEEIDKWAFAHESVLKEIKLPNSLKKIEKFAFFQCTELKSIEFPIGMEAIEKYAFGLCKKLSKVKFSENLQKIGEGAFLGNNFDMVYFPKSLCLVEEEAFLQNKASTRQLNKAVFHGSNVKLEDNAFPDYTKIMYSR